MACHIYLSSYLCMHLPSFTSGGSWLGSGRGIAKNSEGAIPPSRQTCLREWGCFSFKNKSLVCQISMFQLQHEASVRNFPKSSTKIYSGSQRRRWARILTHFMASNGIFLELSGLLNEEICLMRTRWVFNRNCHYQNAEQLSTRKAAFAQIPKPESWFLW